jgi:hypothetical protein
MAWQLIYTSAPRLLEAGRTGFGTVARHPAISGSLASAVERFSQFARLPGHDPRRIVHACRLLTVGSGTYHVLSCLQDAGSDYTGRTNHIAHHLIAEPREIRALASTGLTPADVLLAMAWRTSWSEGPRFLDSAEEVALSSFPVSVSHAWAALTGDPASADILGSREALKGCYLITPPDMQVLEIFREALQRDQAHAWQTRFTTCLEPNDDVADFRWVALSSTSPLRGQVETSNRLILDLTRPNALPAPPERKLIEPALEARKPVAQEAQPPVPAAVELPMASPDVVPSSVGTLDDRTQEPRAKKSKSFTPSIGRMLTVAVVLVVAILGALLKRDSLHKKDRAAYDLEIAQIWTNDKLILPGTRKLLEEQSDLSDGRALLKSHEEFFRDMRRVLHEPQTPVQLTLPVDHKDELKDLKKRLDEWADLHAKPLVNLQTGGASVRALSFPAAYRKWQDLRAAKWRQLAEHLSLKDLPAPEETLIQQLKAEARKALQQAEPEHGTLSSWKQLFAQLGRFKKITDPEVRQWLELWAELDAPHASTYATAQKAASDQSLPGWLRAKAVALKQLHDANQEHHVSEMNRLAGDQHAKEVQQQSAATEDADALAAGHDIYILLLHPNENMAGKITGLPVTASMQLYVGGAWAADSRPNGNSPPADDSLKKWVGSNEENNTDLKFGPTILSPLSAMIMFSIDGTLTTLPEEYRRSPEGIRIVARSQDAVRVLFDLRLVPVHVGAAKPILTPVIEAAVDNAETVTLNLPAGLLNRLHLPGLPKPVYTLRRDGPASEQQIYELRPAGDSSFVVLPPQSQTSSNLKLQDTRRQISELKAGIQKDESDLAENEKTKLAARQKELNREAYTNARSDKEIRLQSLLAQLPSLEGPAPVHFSLPPGTHTLMLNQPNKLELCRLNVVPAARQSP